MNNGNTNARPKTNQVDSSTPENFDHSDEAKSLHLPPWVVAGGFAEYVLACRFYAEHGTWPNGIKPHHPTFRNLPVWQIKWLQKQRNPESMAAWKRANAARRVERRKNEPKPNKPYTGPRRIAPIVHFTATPEDWEAENNERNRLLEIAREHRIHPFVVAAGALKYVLDSRHFARHGVWPDGKPPKRPFLAGLTIWQCKWILLQRDPVKFAEWVEKIEDRDGTRADARKARKAAQREKLVQEIANTAYNQPLPVKLSNLGEYVANRSRKGGRAA